MHRWHLTTTRMLYQKLSIRYFAWHPWNDAFILFMPIVSSYVASETVAFQIFMILLLFANVLQLIHVISKKGYRR